MNDMIIFLTDSILTSELLLIKKYPFALKGGTLDNSTSRLFHLSLSKSEVDSSLI